MRRAAVPPAGRASVLANAADKPRAVSRLAAPTAKSAARGPTASDGLTMTPGERAEFGASLLSWAREHGRTGLPWQVTDSYAVWVSEVMLQQTQVETVKTYYGRFMASFPTLPALAAASEDDVLAAWAGLGYYRRAKFLHKAARQVVSSGLGGLPISAKELMELPGIGRSTAAAIASIAHGEPVAIMDGNVMRVLARRWGETGDVQLSGTQARLWQVAESLVVKASPGFYTQSIMDLGATVCTPKAPSCGACPLSKKCKALASGDPERFPHKPRKPKKRRVEHERWEVLTDGVEVCMVKNEGKSGVWQSMLVFPSCVHIKWERPLTKIKAWSFKHVFSHYDLHVDVEICLISKKSLAYWADREGWSTFKPTAAMSMAVPKPIKDVLAVLDAMQGGNNEAVS